MSNVDKKAKHKKCIAYMYKNADVVNTQNIATKQQLEQHSMETPTDREREKKRVYVVCVYNTP